ncbi:MAG TPA: DNA recombination protein RmuC [Actinomycetes bacterium]|nr:DNA recombination protein RmuC [Actinomycetes bacterium]
MTTVEIVLAGLLTAAVIALIWALRRADASGEVGLVRAELARLTDAVARQGGDDREVRGDLGRVRELVEGLRAGADARARAEGPVWAAVRRLEAVLAGGGARGRAGENLLEEALSHLPPGMLVRDFAVGGRRVEFALALPDGRRLPIDSKWTAARELAELEREQEPGARQALSRRVEEEVTRRAREVRGYLDPALTTPFAVACVPDPAFAACRRAHADAFVDGVVIVPYSSALPVLLTLYVLASRYGSVSDVRDCLAELDAVLGAMEQTLEHKVARATTMLTNAAVDWRTQVGRARGALARARSGPGDAVEPPTPSRGEVAEIVRLARDAVELDRGTRRG